MLYETRSVGGISYLYAILSSFKDDDDDDDDRKQQKKKKEKDSTWYYVVIILRLLNWNPHRKIDKSLSSNAHLGLLSIYIHANRIGENDDIASRVMVHNERKNNEVAT